MPSRADVRLPVLTIDADRRAGTRMGRRRALALVLVHLMVAAHVAHWLITGATLSPLEPSEASETLSTGAINAGAIFLCVLILATLVMGRFFCGWACHLVAYQDAARWLLIKVGLRPKPVRARLLALVPLFAVYWLYGRPIVERLRAPAGEVEPLELALHLTTRDFWQTFPGAGMAAITFLVCGFLIVSFLGSKGFCTYGCPYGALFGVADRLAPGRIRVSDDCRHTGNCTRTCSSGVDVAREVALYGMVVDPGCMKCLDCVAGCPNGALSFGFRPTVAREKAPRRTRRYDFTWGEEALLLALFAGAWLAFYNVYRAVPFLLSLGIAVIVAFTLLAALRLAYAPRVDFQRLALKRDGRLTRAGGAFAATAAIMLAFALHSGVVNWHTSRAADAFEAAHRARGEAIAGGKTRADAGEAASIAGAAAAAHLELARAWALFPIRGEARMAAELRRWAGDPAGALPDYDREMARAGHNPAVAMYRGLALLEVGRTEEARGSIAQAFTSREAPRSQFLELDAELEVLARAAPPPVRDEANAFRVETMRSAVFARPADGDLALRLCMLLLRGPRLDHRDPDEAIRVAERACAANGRTHADLLGLLAWMYAERGRLDDAVQAAEDSVAAARAAGEEEIARQMEAMVAEYRTRR
jgi:ferredoxin